MSEVHQDNSTQEISVEELQQQLAEKDAILADVTSQFESVKAKADQLLDETKKAKAMKREAEAIAKKEAEEKARKEGDFEQLLKSSEEERQKLSEELNGLRTSVTSEKISNEALKIASELADGPNAEILSEFIKRRIQYTQDGVKVTDEQGNLTIATIDELKQEFANSGKYKSLLRGLKSTGSGATGSSDGVTEAKTISRSDFEKMPAAKQMEFFKKGGKLTNSIN